MDGQKYTQNHSNWQTALDRNLARRLLQRALQPGLIRHDLTGSILSRAQKMACRQPDTSLQSRGLAMGKSLSLPPSNLIYAWGMYSNPAQAEPAALKKNQTPDIALKRLSDSEQAGPGLSQKLSGEPTGMQSERTSKPGVNGLLIQRKTMSLKKQAPNTHEAISDDGPAKKSAAGSKVNSDSILGHRQNGSTAQTIHRRTTLTTPAYLQSIPIKANRESTRRPDSRSAAEAIPSAKPEHSGSIPGPRLQAETILSPGTGNRSSAIIRRHADVQVDQGRPYERPRHEMSLQAPIRIVSRDSILRKSDASMAANPSVPQPAGSRTFHSQVPDSNAVKPARVQPAIRRLGANRNLDRTIQPKVNSSTAATGQPRSPGITQKGRQITNPAGIEISTVDPVLAKAKAIAKAPVPFPATAGPGDLGPSIQPHRMRSRDQLPPAEHAFTQKPAQRSARMPKFIQSEAPPRSNSADLGITILQRYRSTVAGDAIQKKATTLQENPLTVAADRNMTLVRSAVTSIKGATLGNPGLNALPPSNGYHPGSPLVMAGAAANAADIQTKPENTLTGPTSGLPGSPTVSAPAEHTASGGDLSSENNINLDDLVNKVWHKLMRQLTVESERRGLQKWHYQN